MDTLVDRFSGVGAPAHQVWLPPLARSPRLSELADSEGPEMTASIGVVDRPFEQRRVPLLVEVGGAGGHIAVVGAPQSGKSHTVRTLLTALALRHDPRRIQFYCLDFGGGTLEALRALPHVGSVANRPDHELVRRIVGHVDAILRSREAGLADEYGDVFLVIDGWQTLREQFGDLEPASPRWPPRDCRSASTCCSPRVGGPTSGRRSRIRSALASNCDSVIHSIPTWTASRPRSCRSARRVGESPAMATTSPSRRRPSPTNVAGVMADTGGAASARHRRPRVGGRKGASRRHSDRHR